jgi:hypothetical protein
MIGRRRGCWTKCCISEDELAGVAILADIVGNRVCHMTKQTPPKRRAPSSLIENGLRLVMAASTAFA